MWNSRQLARDFNVDPLWLFTNPPDGPANVQFTSSGSTHLCPDLLRYEQIGGADNLRGRVVRAFFWLMRLWPV